jgi:hypothetical protein
VGFLGAGEGERVRSRWALGALYVAAAAAADCGCMALVIQGRVVETFLYRPSLVTRLLSAAPDVAPLCLGS